MEIDMDRQKLLEWSKSKRDMTPIKDTIIDKYIRPDRDLGFSRISCKNTSIPDPNLFSSTHPGAIAQALDWVCYNRQVITPQLELDYQNLSKEDLIKELLKLWHQTTNEFKDLATELHMMQNNQNKLRKIRELRCKKLKGE